MLPSSRIGRLSGPALMLGGLLWALGGATALNADALGIGMEGPHLALSVAGLLSLIGLTTLLRHHAGQYGPAGVAGVLVAGAGVVLIIASKNVPSGVSEDVAWALFGVGGAILVGGALLFGIVALVAGGAWFFGGPFVAIGVLSILQLVFLMMVPGAETGWGTTVVLPTLIGTAWAALGYALWSHAGESVPEHRISETL